MSKLHGRENDTVEVVDPVQKSDVAVREEAMLAFWQEHEVFKKSLETPAGDVPVGDFVFYDGPPFATGLPHYGHILAGTIKDAIPRFATMNGYRVRRQWGWDCHGLPLENQIEKELGLATKKDIEEFGIKNFNEKARSTVMRYADDWKVVVPRMGRFVDMENDYKTMDSTYTESVWWAFKRLHDKGLVFEGFKSMHLCPRCGTTLSNFEVNQGYKDIKDIAVTVKLPLLDDAGNVTDTSLLVWTTTPWTLPGNMAAAVNEEFEYVTVKVKTEEGEDTVILAKGRFPQLGETEYEVVEEIKGSDLVGRKYEPPFPWLKEQDFTGKENAWTIYHADYVELGEEGTGAVHLAPAYGEEDMVLAQSKGVPIMHHVNESGHFKDFIADFAGQLVKPKDDDDAEVSHLDADIEIVKALKANGKLFKKENITHSYPHCWRCDTPLLNYATTSWFVNVPKIKDQIIAENNKVNWVPEHVGKNRFGDWLEGARDWAISRQRYWGAPLPIWKNPETGDYKVFGSLEDLKQYVPKSGNSYITMRHGESTKNTTRIVTDKFDAPFPLTEKGIADTKATAQTLKGKVDIIISSPVLRAHETARLVAEEIGISPDAVIIDERIKETCHGVYEGKSLDEYLEVYPSDITKFHSKPEGGEDWSDLRKRTGEFMWELEQTYQNKNILIVSHGDPLAMLHSVVAGQTKEETVKQYEVNYPSKGVAREITFSLFPHNDIYELDYHRPYIDDIELYEGETKLVRVPDVFDCWFESGSMPYAQYHYPFECEDDFLTERYPANFIAEGLDQTRGWFYSLIVLGTALFGKSPFENVIVNGLALAEDGKKMSKSLRNYPDPMELADRTGVDAMRFYLLTAPIVRGEDLNFSEKEVLELQRKNIGRLHNVLAMYEMFKDGIPGTADSSNVLDRWILARLNELVRDVTAGYKAYELDKANRPITDFIDDLSVWYLRRSRDRLKGEDVEDKALALATLRYALRTLALTIAPAMPFYAEYLWQAVKEDSDALSVHLAKWPEAGPVDVDVIANMQNVRAFANMGLMLRTKNKVNLKQPLQSFTISHGTEVPPGWSTEYEDILADELNVKAIVLASLEAGSYDFDWNITPELKAEGAVRELMRAIQGKRKTDGLEPSDNIELSINTTDAGKSAIELNRELLTKTVGAKQLVFSDVEGEFVKTELGDFNFTIRKV